MQLSEMKMITALKGTVRLFGLVNKAGEDPSQEASGKRLLFVASISITWCFSQVLKLVDKSTLWTHNKSSTKML